MSKTFEPLSKQGWIEVICGSMFSGKTQELLRRVNRAKYEKKTIIMFKNIIDTRYDQSNICSHDKNMVEAHAIENAVDILELSRDFSVVGIDEVQFFGPEIVDVLKKLALAGKRVIVAGLDMGYKGLPFYPMPDILAIAEFIDKMHGVCQVCGGLANQTYRKVDDDEYLICGSKKDYEPRCRVCWSLGRLLDNNINPKNYSLQNSDSCKHPSQFSNKVVLE